jgi:hypothetical protein
MEMTGEFRIPAPRERVWQALNDPETLKRAIPGCETIEKVTDTEFTAKVVAKVGPVRATFGGKVNLTDLDPPKAYTISGEGSGGVAGFAKGSAKVKLDEEGDEATRLRYEVQAHVGGKLAQIGSRLIDATSRKMADDFFGRFVEALSPAKQNGAAPPETAVTQDVSAGASETTAIAPSAPQSPGLPEELPQPQPSPAVEAQSRRLPPAVWVTALTATVAAVLYFFTRKDGAR